MNRYQFPIPRATLGVVAVGMTAIAIAVSVFLPAGMRPRGHEIPTVMASKPPAPASNDVAGSIRIEVVGVREAKVVAPNSAHAAIGPADGDAVGERESSLVQVDTHRVPPKRKQQS